MSYEYDPSDHDRPGRGTLVAGRDPAADLVTKAGRFCSEQADDLDELLGPILEASALTDAPATRDHQRLLASVRSADRQQLWSRAVFACMHLAVHVTDHVRALGVLLAQPQVGVPVYAHASIARAALESAALLAYVLAEGQPTDIRLARGVALLLADADAAAKTARRIRGNAMMRSPGPMVAREREQLLELIRRARVETVLNVAGNRVKGVRLAPGLPESPVVVAATDLVEKTFGDLPGIYGMLSGVVHGLPWRLADNAQVDGRQAIWQPNPMDVTASVLGAVTAGAQAGAAFARYRGFGDRPEVVRLQRRAHACDEALRTFGAKHARPTTPFPQR
jgi:hypothetical protein